METKNPLETIEMFRDLVVWANNRPEFLNENKTPNQLIKEFKRRNRVKQTHYENTKQLPKY